MRIVPNLVHSSTNDWNGAGRIMWSKVAKIGFGVFGVVAASLIGLAAVMSDRLTRRETVELIMTADEPCRDAFARALDMFEKDPRAAARASAEAEPVCRASFAALDKIAIFVPQDDYDQERLKRDTIKACAQLAKARGDLLAQFASPSPDEGRMSALNRELAQADKSCHSQFRTLAGR